MDACLQVFGRAIMFSDTTASEVMTNAGVLDYLPLVWFTVKRS